MTDKEKTSLNVCNTCVTKSNAAGVNAIVLV